MLYDFKQPEDYDKFISQYITGDFSTFDMEFFIPEVKKLKAGEIYLEIGVKYGKSFTVACFAAAEGVNLVGIDIEDFEERRNYFKTLGLTNYITFIHGESTRVAKIWSSPIKLLFIDGNHTYESVSADIGAWAKFVPLGGVILFHDCDETSLGVVQAVNEHFAGKITLFKTPEKRTSLAKVVI